MRRGLEGVGGKKDEGREASLSLTKSRTPNCGRIPLCRGEGTDVALEQKGGDGLGSIDML